MSEIDEETIKEEEKETNENLSKGVDFDIDDPEEAIDDEDSPLLDEVNSEIRKIEAEKDKKIQVAVNDKVRKALRAPRLVKVQGSVKAEVEFPEIYKVSGMGVIHQKLTKILEKINKYPDVFNVKGQVKADVEFPAVQKVSFKWPDLLKVAGHVKADVIFPDTQKIEGKVDTGVPVIRAEKGGIDAVPVVFTDLKRLIHPLQQTVQGQGRLVAALERLTQINNDSWLSVAYSGVSNALRSIKASEGKFGGYFYDNPNSSKVYLQVFFDKSGIVLGTTAPDAIYGIPASGAANVELSKGRGFSQNAQIAATTQPNGATAPTTPLPVTLYYK